MTRGGVGLVGALGDELSQGNVQFISGAVGSRRITWALEIKKWMARFGTQSNA